MIEKQKPRNHRSSNSIKKLERRFLRRAAKDAQKLENANKDLKAFPVSPIEIQDYSRGQWLFGNSAE